MRAWLPRLFALLLLPLALPTAPDQAQAQSVAVSCINNYVATLTAVSSTQVVPAIDGKSVGLCGWALDAGSAPPTVQLVYGTGVNCGTGTTPFSISVTLANNGFFLDHQQGVYVQTPPGQALCVSVTGTGSIGVGIYWAQY
jgi:hypothetical protein